MSDAVFTISMEQLEAIIKRAVRDAVAESALLHRPASTGQAAPRAGFDAQSCDAKPSHLSIRDIISTLDEDPGFVYFIRDTHCETIKVGYTGDNPRARLSQLQVSSPHTLELVGTIRGTRETESSIHSRLARYRIRGEWFQETHEVMATIAVLMEPREAVA